MILEEMALCAYKKGEFLFFQEDELENLFLLVEGKLQVDFIERSGKQVVYSFEKPFSIVGDMEILDDQPVIVNVQAIEDSLVFKAPVEMVRTHALEYTPFLKFLIRYLTKKLYFSVTLLTQKALSAEDRMARYLLYRSRIDGNSICLENREALSSILSISLRHLNRILKELSDQKIIRLRNKELTILDPERLKHIPKNMP